VVITGAGGFVGAALVRHYLGVGASVRAVVHSAASLPNLPSAPGLTSAVLELRDVRPLGETFRGADLVVHAAALTRARRPGGWREVEAANAETTWNVIEGCRRGEVPRLVHISSTAAIGISPDPRRPADERTEYNLGQFGLSYNDSKRATERLALDANGHGVETVVANPGFVFGRFRDRYRGEEVIARVLEKSPVVCTGGGLSIVHIDDVVAGIDALAGRGRAGERYVLSGDNVTFRAIADIVCEIAGVHKRIVSVPGVLRDVLGMVQNARARARGSAPNLALMGRYAYPFYSSEKARTELGYQPRSFARIVGDYLDATRSSR
jgi:dihydroflavonol-4-reductase